MTPDSNALADHRLLAPLTPDERASVQALCHEVEVPADTVLMRQGEPPPGLHLLLDGQVQVTVRVHDEPHDVAVLGPGAVLGELSLLEQDGISGADVTTLSPVRAAVVPAAAADQLLRIDAIALQLDALARNRRATNRALRIPPVEAGKVDGRQLGLRPLWPEDWRQLASGTGRVSEESLRMRFFAMPRLTERTFRRLTLTNHRDQFAWGAFVGDELVGIGRHALQAENRGVAELAVLVADELHGRGVGTRLIAAVAAAADAHGAHDLFALARAENAAVHALLARFGAVWGPGAEAGIVTAQWPVATALASVQDKVLLAGAHAVAAAVLGDVLDR